VSAKQQSEDFMAVEVHRKLFTVEEYHRMLESGILSEDDRVELVDGEIIEMAAKGYGVPHCQDHFGAKLR
jgi:Uma2 family endonuclease